MKHTASWILWLVLSLTLTLTTRNPFYLSFQILSLLLLGVYIAKQKHHAFWLSQNIRFLLTMLVISSLVNALFTHTGSTTLINLPDHWILVGGSITLESLIYGQINGLIIGAIFVAFNIINLALSIRQLTHLIPGALRPIAMTVTITLTFLPSIQQRAQEIKEAQLIRGNQMKKIRDWLPLLLPLLISSLENAISLSESMTSRGFETQSTGKITRLTLVSLILATFIIFSAWVLSLFDYPGFIILPLYAIGGGLVAVTFISASRKLRTTHFKKETWSKKDALSSGIFITTIIGTIILHQLGMLPTFYYSPYPGLSLPGLSLSGFLVISVLLFPMLVGKNDSI